MSKIPTLTYKQVGFFNKERYNVELFSYYVQSSDAFVVICIILILLKRADGLDHHVTNFSEFIEYPNVLSKCCIGKMSLIIYA